jgi:hypothetical protein
MKDDLVMTEVPELEPNDRRCQQSRIFLFLKQAERQDEDRIARVKAVKRVVAALVGVRDEVVEVRHGVAEGASEMAWGPFGRQA